LQRVTLADEVRLEVPAMPEFLRLARLTASGLGSRLGFTVDQVEDLKLAIDELCFGLTGPNGRPGSVNVRFRLGPGSLEVSGDGVFEDEQVTPEQSELSKLILDALVDEHELRAGSRAPSFRMVKRRTSG
jgi:serine/threonine-protein kinase RsbW